MHVLRGEEEAKQKGKEKCCVVYFEQHVVPKRLVCRNTLGVFKSFYEIVNFAARAWRPHPPHRHGTAIEYNQKKVLSQYFYYSIWKLLHDVINQFFFSFTFPLICAS